MWNAATEIRLEWTCQDITDSTLTPGLGISVVTSINLPLAGEGGVGGHGEDGVVLPRDAGHTAAYGGHVVWDQISLQVCLPLLWWFVARARLAYEA